MHLKIGAASFFGFPSLETLRSSELVNDCHSDFFLGRCYLTTSA